MIESASQLEGWSKEENELGDESTKNQPLNDDNGDDNLDSTSMISRIETELSVISNRKKKKSRRQSKRRSRSKRDKLSTKEASSNKLTVQDLEAAAQSSNRRGERRRHSNNSSDKSKSQRPQSPESGSNHPSEISIRKLPDHDEDDGSKKTRRRKSSTRRRSRRRRHREKGDDDDRDDDGDDDDHEHDESKKEKDKKSRKRGEERERKREEDKERKKREDKERKREEDKEKKKAEGKERRKREERRKSKSKSRGKLEESDKPNSDKVDAIARSRRRLEEARRLTSPSVSTILKENRSKPFPERDPAGVAASVKDRKAHSLDIRAFSYCHLDSVRRKTTDMIPAIQLNGRVELRDPSHIFEKALGSDEEHGIENELKTYLRAAQTDRNVPTFVQYDDEADAQSSENTPESSDEEGEEPEEKSHGALADQNSDYEDKQIMFLQGGMASDGHMLDRIFDGNLDDDDDSGGHTCDDEYEPPGLEFEEVEEAMRLSKELAEIERAKSELNGPAGKETWYNDFYGQHEEIGEETIDFDDSFAVAAEEIPVESDKFEDSFKLSFDAVKAPEQPISEEKYNEIRELNSAPSRHFRLKKVAFSTVRRRDYALCFGDNPSCSDTMPVSLHWAHSEERTWTVGDFEAVKELFPTEHQGPLEDVQLEDNMHEEKIEPGGSSDEPKHNIDGKMRVRRLSRQDRYELLVLVGGYGREDIIQLERRHALRLDREQKALRSAARGLNESISNIFSSSVSVFSGLSSYDGRSQSGYQQSVRSQTGRSIGLSNQDTGRQSRNNDILDESQHSMRSYFLGIPTTISIVPGADDYEDPGGNDAHSVSSHRSQTSFHSSIMSVFGGGSRAGRNTNEGKYKNSDGKLCLVTDQRTGQLTVQSVDR